MKVGITGQAGFVGEHLYNRLSIDESVELVEFKRDYFEDSSSLLSFVDSCDVVVHLAAMNRHKDPQVIYDTNISLVKKLIEACEKSESNPTILFSSSTQESADNHYGRSKKEGERLFLEHASKNDARVVSMIIPNVFGPFGKPFYNSVVATFCHQLTHGDEPNIINDGDLKLIYVNELVDEICSLVKGDKSGKTVIPHNHEIKVSELAAMLTEFRDNYLVADKFPNINTPLRLALFNTYRCYIDHDHYPRPFTKHTDPRGSFVEIVRADTSGQFSFSTTVPGITRGEHFHTRKAERFAVIKGKAQISLRKINTTKIIDYTLDGDQPAYVDMPIWHTHNITNIGDEELVCLFWINEPYDADDPDTYFVKVRESQ